MTRNSGSTHSLKPARRVNVTRFATIQAVLVIAVLAACFALPSVAPASARGGGGGGGGGGQPPVTLPADWPATVPVPAGVLQQTLGAAPHWILVLVAEGNYPDVMASIRTLYTANGFVEPNPLTAPYFFENDLYRVSVIGAARDHSPTQTNVNVYLDRK